MQVTEFLGIDPLPAKLLLRRYRWDVHTVMDNFEQATRFLEQSAAASAAGEEIKRRDEWKG